MSHGKAAKQLSLRAVGLGTGDHPRLGGRKLGFTPQVQSDMVRECGNRVWKQRHPWLQALGSVVSLGITGQVPDIPALVCEMEPTVDSLASRSLR